MFALTILIMSKNCHYYTHFVKHIYFQKSRFEQKLSDILVVQLGFVVRFGQFTQHTLAHILLIGQYISLFSLELTNVRRLQSKLVGRQFI